MRRPLPRAYGRHMIQMAPQIETPEPVQTEVAVHELQPLQELPVSISDDADGATAADDTQEAETSALVRSDLPAGTIHLVIKEARLSVQGRADEASLRILLEYLLR